jgi:purine-binding chemotaxis protein CheW
MFFRRSSQPTPRGAADPQSSQDALRQAIERANAGGGAVSSETLAELARRAGVSDPARLAEASRIAGLGIGQGATVMPQHIFFMLGEAECALPANAVEGVNAVSEIAHVPNIAPWVLGVVQVWGAIVSVVDFRRFVGLPAQAISSRSRLLVVTRREMKIGLVVDSVTEMRALGDIAVGPVDGRVTPGWAMPYAQGLIQIEGHVVTLLDPDRLLFSEQIHQYRAAQD